MRLALIISSMSLGGASRAMSLLANHWATRAERVALITFDDVTQDAWQLDPAVERICLDVMGDSGSAASALVNSARRISKLRRAIKVCRADAVLSFEDRMNVLVVLATAGLGVRTVICERTDPARHRIPAVWRVLRRLTYPFSDALGVQTAAVFPWARSVMWRSSKVAIVPNVARDMARFLCPDAIQSRTVASVGRLVPGKGFDLLVEAFADATEDLSDWRLVIAGDGPERERLERIIRERGLDGRVLLPGSLSEPGEVLAAAAFFVMSSEYEGFPNAMLEAMACGLPVISTRNAGSLELISHEGDGLLVDVNDRGALAASMRRLMTDAALRGKLAKRSLEVARRYCLDAVIQKWDALLEWPQLSS